MKADHERELVGAFFAPEVRPRYLSLLSTVKGRKKFVSRLAHLDLLDARFAHLIDPEVQTTDAIEDDLKRRGAPASCYVVSENPRVDGRQMALRDALEAIGGSAPGTFLSCVAGCLAYFEGEELMVLVGRAWWLCQSADVRTGHDCNHGIGSSGLKTVRICGIGGFPRHPRHRPRHPALRLRSQGRHTGRRQRGRSRGLRSGNFSARQSDNCSF